MLKISQLVRLPTKKYGSKHLRWQWLAWKVVLASFITNGAMASQLDAGKPGVLCRTDEWAGGYNAVSTTDLPTSSSGPSTTRPSPIRRVVTADSKREVMLGLSVIVLRTKTKPACQTTTCAKGQQSDQGWRDTGRVGSHEDGSQCSRHFSARRPDGREHRCRARRCGEAWRHHDCHGTSPKWGANRSQ